MKPLEMESLWIRRDAVGEWPTRFPTIGNGSSIVPFHYRVVYDGSVEGMICDEAYIDGVYIGTPHECGPATKEDAGVYEDYGSISISPEALPWPFNPLGHAFRYEVSIDGFKVSRETNFFFREEVLYGLLFPLAILGVGTTLFLTST